MKETEKSNYAGTILAGTKDGENWGFFLPESVMDNEGNITLSDYNILTTEEHMALIDGQSQGKVITFKSGAKPTLEDPPPTTKEELSLQIRKERDRLIEDINWRIERYQQQSALGIQTNDSNEWYQRALKYVQLLRDIPQQENYPERVVYPEFP